MTTKSNWARRVKKRSRLTPEQKKAIWAKSEANAGAGWHSNYEDAKTHDPRVLEVGKREE